MKIITSIIIFLITLSFASSQNYMEDRLIVRINDIQLDDSKLDEEFSELGIKLERRILPLKASYLYGNKLRFKSSNNEKLKRIIETEKQLLKTYVVSFTENIDALKLADIIESNSELIEIAEPYHIYNTQGFTPNDPFVGNQEDALEAIKAFDAWEIEKGSEDVVIAISDNGVQ